MMSDQIKLCQKKFAKNHVVPDHENGSYTVGFHSIFVNHIFNIICVSFDGIIHIFISRAGFSKSTASYKEIF
ncbi:MAG: hypothetical protein WCG25_08545 [bacterium]